MSLVNQNKENRVLRKVRSSKDIVDFSRIGGLDHHLKTLREVVIFPLLHGNIFTHFKIKAPRGVLFYGPPGTGKTLVAGALVAELNKEGIGKVSFFQRKGADVLDKWVGESEKNLRNLFEKATKSRPSVIFFDELDGLAPTRTDKNDHIHASVVATLLSLMDGLDSKPGVVVIGATNRIEAIDPALRRKGRFDKELYFPLPGVEARKEIIQVHVNNWKQKPTQKFITKLADLIPGFCGSDIQALCSEAVLCCLKRVYPTIDKKGFNIKIEMDALKVDECDFLQARLNLIPSSMKQGLNIRNLSSIIEPLLKRQHNRIIKYIKILWPHFLQEGYKFTIGEKRYAGRILLIGKNMQGLNTHLVPSLLKNLEHVPSFVYDTRVFSEMKTNFINVQVHYPAIILLSRVDEWWDFIDECQQHTIVSTLEEIHAGLPILTMATCRVDVPKPLHNFFYNNSTVLVKIENPNQKEREDFLAPLFFDEENSSLYSVWENSRNSKTKIIKCEKDVEVQENGRKRKKKTKIDEECEKLGLGYLSDSYRTPDSTPRSKRKKRDRSNHSTSKNFNKTNKSYISITSNSDTSLQDLHKRLKRQNNNPISISSSRESLKNKQYFTRVLSDLLNQRSLGVRVNSSETNMDMYFYDTVEDMKQTINYKSSNYTISSGETDKNYMEKIYNLWKHAARVTANNMAVAQLELMYDVISTCIGIHQHSIDSLIENLGNVLRQIENSYRVSTEAV
ncbi:ATPase family AAA domain-containing protein 2-like isoform X2 [Diorhabda carinulata]|uniref:ATPase family AAA domain-containing protein 2-like isoform X2 n=1 Tax=Diorhabda carinulata TaxID=1163345 RepID=UPI0025A023B9|nr:ATPase family AAA domain-containing protein 2-like isoform X2 [Diorhabda carinulata]